MTTINDVASAAGVSLATVSRVINGSPSVGKTTRLRVEAVLRAMNYQPSRAAQVLARGQTVSLGVVMPTLADPFFMTMADGINRVCRELGVYMVLSCSGLSAEAEEAALETLRGQGCNAMVLHSKFLSEARIKFHANQMAGLVLINRRCEAIDNRCVWLDNESGGIAMIRYLCKQGHRKFAFINSEHPISDPLERQNGWVKGLAYSGLPFSEAKLALGAPTPEGGYECARQLLEAKANISALVAYNDNMALGAIRALKDHGLEVPSDVSVVGFDDSYVARACMPELTTLRYPIAEMAQQAARLALANAGCANPSGADSLVSGGHYPVLIGRKSVDFREAKAP